MQVSDALACLGSKRVIWIDDFFNVTPSDVATLLIKSIEITRACAFPELAVPLERFEYEPERAEEDIAQILADAGPARVATIKDGFFKKEAENSDRGTVELGADEVSRACALLGVAEGDQWTFAMASRHLDALCKDGNDAGISYIVDLHEAGGSDTQGVEILRTLKGNNSAGTAFILTHETNRAGESTLEDQLRTMLAADGGDKFGFPMCVVAKDRLYDDPGNSSALEQGLSIGIKRAGLRRTVHDVLLAARGQAEVAFEAAALGLLSVPPEQLESHVFERGFKEGVSELHVVERAVTAHISQHLRNFFGQDASVRQSIRNLRALREIKLTPVPMAPDPNLMAFREAEVWESDALINSAYAPIACGDVFETDPEEDGTRKLDRRFLLLAQPCDISLRPVDNERAEDTAFLIPIKRKETADNDARNDRKAKAPLLPFRLGGQIWTCDFRNATVANVAVLDLASFRSDGRVRVDDGHQAPPDLLVAQRNVYGARTAAAQQVLAAGAVVTAGLVDPMLQLSFSAIKPFKEVFAPSFVAASKAKIDGVTVRYPKRVTWKLRRCGRIRMPYSAAVLDQYLSLMSRQAFDMDYMNPGLGDGEQGAPGGDVGGAEGLPATEFEEPTVAGPGAPAAEWQTGENGENGELPDRIHRIIRQVLRRFR